MVSLERSVGVPLCLPLAVVPIGAVRREGGLKCAGLQGDQGVRKCSWCPWKVEVGQKMRVPVSLSSLPIVKGGSDGKAWRVVMVVNW